MMMKIQGGHHFIDNAPYDSPPIDSSIGAGFLPELDKIDDGYAQIAISQGKPIDHQTEAGQAKQSAADDGLIDYEFNANGRVSSHPARESNRYLSNVYADAHRSMAATKAGHSKYHLIANNEHDFLNASMRLHSKNAGSLETSALKHQLHVKVESARQYWQQHQTSIEQLLTPQECKTLADVLFYEQTHNGNNAALFSDLMRYLMLAVAQKEGGKLLYADFDKSREFHDLQSKPVVRVRHLASSVIQSANANIRGNHIQLARCNDYMATHPADAIDFQVFLKECLQRIQTIQKDGVEDFPISKGNVFSHGRVFPKNDYFGNTQESLMQRLEALGDENDFETMSFDEFDLNEMQELNAQLSDFKLLRKDATLKATGPHSYKGFANKVQEHRALGEDYLSSVSGVFNAPKAIDLQQKTHELMDAIQKQFPQKSRLDVIRAFEADLFYNHADFQATKSSDQASKWTPLTLDELSDNAVRVPTHLVQAWHEALTAWASREQTYDAAWL
jgi:hypothetical protein